MKLNHWLCRLLQRHQKGGLVPNKPTMPPVAMGQGTWLIKRSVWMRNGICSLPANRNIKDDFKIIDDDEYDQMFNQATPTQQPS